MAKVGKSSYGWFMGFKLHMIINNKGEIMAVKITKENRSDILPVANLAFGLTGKIYGDKGYISSNLFLKLFNQGLRLFTNLRKDMKNHLLEMSDESVNRISV
ncbi:MAG: transposase [Rickettsiaceae bacterium]